MRSRAIAAATIGLALAAGAARAEASTLAVDAPCYLSGTPVGASGSGFTPGGPVSYSFDGQLAAGGSADPAGNVAQQLTAPALPSGSVQHTYNLAAQDGSNPALAATIPVRVTRRAATITPHRASPRRRVKMRVHALEPGKPVYLHYLLHGRQRFRVRLGTARAPCGSLAVRRRFFPVRRPRVGSWTFQFDSRRRYSKRSQPQIRGTVQIYNVLR